MNTSGIEELAAKLRASLPTGLQSIGDEVEGNFRQVLAGALDKLDVVSREEFEVQKSVLARTREKLAALEAEIEALEKHAP